MPKGTYVHQSERQLLFRQSELVFFAFSSFLLIITATALMDLFPARLVFYKFQLELLLNAMTWIYSFAVANL